MAIDPQIEVAYKLTVEEVMCKCGCQSHHMHVDFLNAWEKLRKGYGKPIKGVSFVRCKEHNKATGGAPNSGHVVGMAFDPAKSTFDMNDKDNLLLAMRCGFVGYGRSNDGSNRQHLDTKTRPNVAFWQYTPNGMIGDEEAAKLYEQWKKEGKII
jgi:hypothetical protein